MTIGDRETALMLYNRFEGDMYSTRPAPKGFRRVGQGAYRTAVLDKSTNVVYKIGCYDSNTSEAANSRRLFRRSTRRLPFELRIARARTYRMPRFGMLPECVSAQEYVVGGKQTYCRREYGWDWTKCSCRQPLCYVEAHSIIEDFTDLSDIHSGNVLIDKSGTFWVIDLAS